MGLTVWDLLRFNPNSIKQWVWILLLLPNYSGEMMGSHCHYRHMCWWQLRGQGREGGIARGLQVLHCCHSTVLSLILLILLILPISVTDSSVSLLPIPPHPSELTSHTKFLCHKCMRTETNPNIVKVLMIESPFLRYSSWLLVWLCVSTHKAFSFVNCGPHFCHLLQNESFQFTCGTNYSKRHSYLILAHQIILMNLYFTENCPSL